MGIKFFDNERIMIVYNDRSANISGVDPAEAPNFSKRMADLYVAMRGLEGCHSYGIDLGGGSTYLHPSGDNYTGFIVPISDYIWLNNIELVLFAPGTPHMFRDNTGSITKDLAIDAIAAHSLWYRRIGALGAYYGQRPYKAANVYVPTNNLGPPPDNYTYYGGWGTDQFSGGWEHQHIRGWLHNSSRRAYGRIGIPYFALSPDPGPLENEADLVRIVTDAINNEQSYASALSKDYQIHLGVSQRDSVLHCYRGLYAGRALEDAGLGAITKYYLGSFSENPFKKDEWPQPVYDYNRSTLVNATIAAGPQYPVWATVGHTLANEGYHPPETNPDPHYLNYWDVQPGAWGFEATSGLGVMLEFLQTGACAIVIPLREPFNTGLVWMEGLVRAVLRGYPLAAAICESGMYGGWVTTVIGDPGYAPFGLEAGQDLMHPPAPMHSDRLRASIASNYVNREAIPL